MATDDFAQALAERINGGSWSDPRWYTDEQRERWRGHAKALWRPIETAPKDGTDILVYCGPASDPIWGIACWDEGAWRLWNDAEWRRHDWPTHWMPLPPLPES
jgi:hypothetical protein